MNLIELKEKYDIRVDELEDFTRIQVKEDEGSEFYKDLADCLKECDDNLTIANGVMGNASKEDFFKGEEIINQVLEGINPEWSDLQKTAFVHYKIGKLVSYTPDFTYAGRYANAPKTIDARNIWKSLVTGESVCNGIVSIARNMMSRVGVHSEELKSGTHSFLLIQVEGGNIIIDPTWDLQQSLYGARPLYFGKTYEQIRNEEIPFFSNAHKLENPPENVIEIPEEELREIYHSIGYTTEDRKFMYPICNMVNDINSETYDGIDEKLDVFFARFTQDFSKEATHLAETRTMLEQCLGEFGFKQEDIVTKFVYSQSDEDCQNPILTIFINNEQVQKKIKMLNLTEMKFEDLDFAQLDSEYKVHNLDTTEPFWKKHLKELDGQDSEIDKQDDEIDKL